VLIEEHESDDHINDKTETKSDTWKKLHIRIPKDVRKRITDPTTHEKEQKNQSKDNKAIGRQKPVDDDVFLYIRKGSYTVDIDKTLLSRTPVEVKLKERNETLVINLDYVEELELDKTNPAQNVESITEFVWLDTKLDYKKLPEYYMKLSKIRLTGMFLATLIVPRHALIE